MTPEQFARVEQLFDAASRLPLDQRDRFVERQARSDPEVLAALRALLAEEGRATAAADALSHKLAAAADDAARQPVMAEGPGSRIGPYELLRQLGEGGFGVVFLAQQEQPVARQVALKIIKLGMDTRQVVARFEQERQALALMDHPNIARVIDAGATATGRPFFVMDYVEGQSIADYADQHNLTIDERLELFGQVCNAVQHAHGKGIIHRDLKPSNILVATRDGKPLAKVIDFGIAKATSSKLTDKTLFTEHLQIIGTLQYMSPEQAAGSLDIDTRTDVYSLGVLLYELLTGSTPFDSKTLNQAMYAEVQRLIREVDPPRPSTRVSDSRDTLANIAAHRRVEPRRLGTLIRGELDWIVMKALEKDRARRYDTASGLALDIQRYLAGEAVVAAPPSASYRVRKFARRNKGLVAAAAAVTVALAIGLIAFAWQARIAGRARDRAQTAEAETRQRADELQQVADFQAHMLAQIDPSNVGMRLGADVKARLAQALDSDRLPTEERNRRVDAFAEQWARINATDSARTLIDQAILQPATATIARQFAAQPVLAARLRQTLAELYQNLGLLDAAVPLQNAALDGRRSTLGEGDADTIDSCNRLVGLLLAQGKLEEAEPLARRTLESSARALGAEHVRTLIAHNNLGYVLLLRGQLDEAEPHCRRAYERLERVAGPEHIETLSALDNYARLLQAQGQLAEAEARFRDELARHRHAFGDDEPHTLLAANNLGRLLLQQGKFGESEASFRDVLERERRVVGEDHADTATALVNLSFAIQNQGRVAEAEPLLREGLAKYQRVLGELHPDTLAAKNNLGILLQDQQKLADAEPLLREALAARRLVLGEDHADTLGSIGNLGRLLMAQARYAEAEIHLAEALDKKRRLRGDDNPDTLTSINNFGALLQSQGKLREAEPYFREAMEKCRRVLGAEHPNTMITTINTGTVVAGQKRYAEAVELLAPAEPIARQAFTGAYGAWLARLLLNLGRARGGLGEFAAAERGLLEAQPLFEQTLGPKHRDTRGCAQAVVELYVAWDQAEPGKGHDAKAASWRSKLDAGK
jgi:serine/threonine protein kinase/Tfp pilus assembly protein PilF